MWIGFLLLDFPDLVIGTQRLEIVVPVDVMNAGDELMRQLIDGILKLGESIAHLGSPMRSEV